MRKEFFEKHVTIIRTNKLHCEECGDRLKGDYSEVAHILEKSFFKSIETNDDNVLYLCSWKSPNNCHAKFDTLKLEERASMKVFKKAQQRVKELLEIVTEKYNYKILDKWLL